MHSHHIEQMVHALKSVLKNRSKAQGILERYWQNRVAIVWEIADVYRAANERELAITNAEAREVLQDLLKHHNAQYGIKWEDITTMLEQSVMGRKLTKREVKRFVEKDIITIQK